MEGYCREGQDSYQICGAIEEKEEEGGGGGGEEEEEEEEEGGGGEEGEDEAYEVGRTSTGLP